VHLRSPLLPEQKVGLPGRGRRAREPLRARAARRS
jgi:hypothetical protein